MKENFYAYTLETHMEWVRKLEKQFGKIFMDESFHGINSIIEIKVVKSYKCTLTLTLDFGRCEPREQRGSILCTYGTLREIRRFIQKNYESWEVAIAAFEDLKHSSMKDVRKQFKDPKQSSKRRSKGGK